MVYIGYTLIGFIVGFAISYLTCFIYLRVTHRERKRKEMLGCDIFIPEEEPSFERKCSVDGSNARNDFTIK